MSAMFRVRRPVDAAREQLLEPLVDAGTAVRLLHECIEAEPGGDVLGEKTRGCRPSSTACQQPITPPGSSNSTGHVGQLAVVKVPTDADRSTW
jgi:hypothetical protein